MGEDFWEVPSGVPLGEPMPLNILMGKFCLKGGNPLGGFKNTEVVIVGVLNWKRCSDSRMLKVGKEFERTQEKKIRDRYRSYRAGQFWIGNRKVDRWYPMKVKRPSAGLWVNSMTGEFEVWSEKKKVSSIPFKKDWKSLVWWAEKHGFETATQGEFNE